MIKVKELLTEKKFTITSSSLKLLKELELSVNEIIFILYYDNTDNKEFNIEHITESTGLTTEEVMTTLDSLMSKKLVSLDTGKDHYQKSIEIINLEGFYSILEDQFNSKVAETSKTTIFDTFSNEFNRKLTSMEYEIINGWLNNNYSEELILGALKEAVFNGVNNFRYIDKILYEWNKKGFKTMNDVNNNLKSRSNNKEQELFDYNWLEEE